MINYEIKAIKDVKNVSKEKPDPVKYSTTFKTTWLRNVVL